MPSGSKSLRVGSRDSKLALWQANFVRKELEFAFPDRSFENISMPTIGDKMLELSLSQIGEKSLFTKELEQALAEGQIDIVVHSLKDVPTTLPDNMVLGAIGKREDPRDAVIFATGSTYTRLSDMPPGSKVGTSAPRRVSQLRRLHPHLVFTSIRGNLDTRFEALETGEVSAIILAVAGVKRMGMSSRIAYSLEPSECMWAVGQAALAVECRASDQDTLELLCALTHHDTVLRVVAERSFMKRFGGGCNIPVAAWSELNGRMLTLKGGVFAMNDDRCVVQTVSVELPPLDEGPFSTTASYAGIVSPKLATACLEKAEKLGENLAIRMVNQGAMKIVEQARKEVLILDGSLPGANGNSAPTYEAS